MSNTKRLEQAGRLYQTGNAAQAAGVYRSIIATEPSNAPAWYALAMIENKLGRLKAALECVERAIGADSRQINYYMLKGNILQDMGRLDVAEKSFRRVLQLNPGYPQAYNNLGIVLRDQHKIENAVVAFQHAIRLDTGYFRAYNNLGMAFQAHGLWTEAVESYQRAIRLKPDYFLAMHNMAVTYMTMGNDGEAEIWFRRALSLNRKYLPSLLVYGRMLLEQRKLKEAETCMLQAIQAGVRDAEVYNQLGEALATQEKTRPAQDAYYQSYTIAPTNLKAALGAKLTLPLIYQDGGVIDEVRRNFEVGLSGLRVNIEMFLNAPADKILSDLLWNNFFLAYQGRDDKELQREFSGFVEDLLAYALPQHMEMIPRQDCSGRRIRVGFLSSFFYKCTVGKYFSAWATHLDQNRFEIFVYHTSYINDAVTEDVRAGVNHFRRLTGSLISVADTVRGDELDILVYPEIGMNGQTFALSALRLAPVQCAGWGHPVTTGHSNIDHFLSCALMEPDGAQAHYTEALLLLPEIGTYYPQNSLPDPVGRSALSLPEDRNLYLCPQSLFKIHPDNDELFLRILDGDDKGVLVFFSSQHGATTDAFISRLTRAFDRHGMEKSGRVRFLPNLGHEDYLRVNMLCDVMLDTLFWSGGNTSLDALSCSLPIVTLPGQFMRGRQSYGMLLAMDIPELVAKDEDDYVRLVLLLGQNHDYREEISLRIRGRIHRIFESDAAIRDLENQLARLVEPECIE